MGRTGGWLRVLVLSMLTGPGGEAATRMRTQSKSNKPQLCQIHISVTVSMHTVLHVLTSSQDIQIVQMTFRLFQLVASFLGAL